MKTVEVDPVAPLLDSVYDEILAVSFPPEELGPPEGLRSGLAGGDLSVVAALDDEGSPVAVAVGEISRPTNVALLSYLAVRPGVRSTGLGGALLAHVRAVWQDRWQPCAMLAEIEHPAAHRVTVAYGDPVARMRFYHRHGLRALDVPYFQPALSAGASRVYGLVLCAMTVADDCLGERSGTIDGRRISPFVEEYLTHTEGLIGTDPACQDLFTALARPGGVALLSLDDPSALPCSKPRQG